jgi:hypothetical protein
MKLIFFENGCISSAFLLIFRCGQADPIFLWDNSTCFNLAFCFDFGGLEVGFKGEFAVFQGFKRRKLDLIVVPPNKEIIFFIFVA